MAQWLPEGMVILGSLLGGMSLYFQERQGEKIPASEMIPSEASTSKDCGAISLYLVCRLEGVSTSFEEIRKLTKTSLTGTSMFDLKEAAEKQGFNARGNRCSFDSLWSHLRQRGHYAILYFREGHFAPAVKIVDGKIRMIDTRRLETKDCSADDLNRIAWEGTALFLENTNRE
jgi:ABC-type bacteriocin/lantibiotic exporter with double-glycine peptidase domain